MIKRLLRSITPGFMISAYHWTLAFCGAVRYGFPANKLLVIGVTGTSGKTTTSYLIAQLFELAGHTVGMTSTALFKVADKEWLNDKKMTMLGRWQTQRLLRDMVDAGCDVAVVETSSEGIKQFRHVGIHYDAAVFTNLTPEHIEAHGGFTNYKNAKLKLFRALAASQPKQLQGQAVPRTIVANVDSEHAPDFLNFTVEQKIAFSLNTQLQGTSPQPLIASDIASSESGLSFSLNGHTITAPLIGAFNTYNIVAALATVSAYGHDLAALATLAPQLKPSPGRLERIDAGQPFSVIVDFAFEPNAMSKLYETVESFAVFAQTPPARIIHVLGGTGGGRDTARRPVLGQMAAEHAAYVIVTDEDPYDEDPLEIISQVALGARQAGKQEGKDLFKILDRRAAIAKAFSLAEKNDMVLITGKGSEQAIVTKNNRFIAWDDRTVAREELAKLGFSQ